MLRRVSVTILLLVLLPATVHAFDHHHHHSSGGGSSGDGCGSSSSKSSASAPPSSASPSLPSSSHKRAFVTSTTYSGALGGLKAADAACQASASTGGLPGVFHAWVSDGSASAYDRTTEVGAWYTTGDDLAFSSRADLRGAPKSELLDEYGGYPASAAGAWTGTDSGGAATGQDCEGWTNASAEVAATTGSALADATWGGGNAPLRCNLKAPLICFQQ